MAQYSGAHCVKFENTDQLNIFLDTAYSKDEHRAEIKFDNEPEKIVLVIANSMLKDVFSYYKKNGFIEFEHYDLRNYPHIENLEKKIYLNNFITSSLNANR